MTTPKTVVYTWLQVTPTTLTTVVRTARSTNEPSGINDLDNDATEFKYPGLPASQLELTKPLEAAIYSQVQLPLIQSLLG